jgi:drug/metabolite transporter (DMT)-like permease
VRHNRAAYLAWLAVCVIWGTTYLGIRIALETVPPALVGALRYCVAGVALAIILRARRERIPGREHWPGLALLGFLMIGLGNGGVIWAEQWVPSGLAAVIMASCPFWMVGLESLLPTGERLTRQGITGLLTGFTGILLLVRPDLASGDQSGRHFIAGLVALQFACIGWSLGSSYSKRHARKENALGAAAVQMIFGGAFLLIAATARGEWRNLTFTWRSGAAELYLIVFGSLLAYSAYTYALKHLPVSTVSLYAYVNPVIAVALGTLLAGEPFGWREFVTSAIVFAGVAVVRWRSPETSTLRARTNRAVA